MPLVLALDVDQIGGRRIQPLGEQPCEVEGDLGMLAQERGRVFRRPPATGVRARTVAVCGRSRRTDISPNTAPASEITATEVPPRKNLHRAVRQHEQAARPAPLVDQDVRPAR